MRKNAVRLPETGTLQHSRPEKRVEVDDVLADKMIDLRVVSGHPVLIEIEVISPVTQIQEAGHVSHRRIEPHVEVLVRGTRNQESEIGCVPRKIPVA